MGLNWKLCFLCKGQGWLTERKTRIQKINEFLNISPILPDEDKKCPICKGKGQVPLKIFPTNPWFKRGEK